MKNYSKYIWMFLMVLGISISQQALAVTETFDLTSSAWDWPTEFSKSERTYCNCKSLTLYQTRKQGTSGLIMQEGNKNCNDATTLGYILLPTFNGTVSTVTLEFISGSSSTQTLTLYAGATSKGTKETTGITTGTTVSWTSLNIASGTIIKIANECGAKAQLKTITVVHNGTSNPCFYNIYYDGEGSGSVSGPAYAAAGETVNFTLSPASGWHNEGTLVYDDDYEFINELLAANVSSFTMPASNVNVYAYFASCTSYTVTLSGSPAGTVTNGTISASPSSACEGATVSLTATPATGYKLGSWDVYRTGTPATKVSVTNNAFTMPEYGVTVDASFSAKQSTITFDKNGGSGGDNGTTGTYGSAMTTVTAPTRDGYDFGGYYDGETSNNGSGTKYYNANGSSARTWDKNTESATTLFAQWTEKDYDVTLDNNSPTTSGSTSVTVTYNKNTHTAITNPTKTGKSFAGWWSGSGGTGSMVIAADGTLQANVEGYTGAGGIWTRTSGTTLYAKWADTYSVAIASVDHVTISMTSPSSVGENSSGNVIPGATVTLSYSSVDAANGYSWYGWNVYKTGDPSTTVSVNGSNQFTMPEYDVTVSAKLFGELVAWCEAQVIYKSVGEEDYIATVDGSGDVPAYSPQTGCGDKAFVGWTSAAVAVLQQTSPTIETADGSLTGITENTTLYAVFASRNGGKITGSETLSITETFETATPTKGTNQTVLTACTSDVMAWEYCYGKVTTTTITNVGPYAGSTFADLMMYGTSSANTNTHAYIRTTRQVDNLSKVSFYVKANGGASGNSYSVEYSTDGSVWTAIKSGESFTTTYTEKEYEIPSSVPSAYIRIITAYSTLSGDYHLCIDDVKFYTKARTYYLTDYSTTCDKAASATVTWNNDGGTLVDGYSEPTSPSLGTWITMPALTKDNYRFDGWKATIEGNLQADVYAVDGLFLVNHNVTLTAQWSELFQVSDPATGVTSTKDKTVRSATFTMKVIGDRSFTPVIEGLSDVTQFAVTVGTGTNTGTADKEFEYTFIFTPSAYKIGQGMTDNATFRFKDEASGTVSEPVTITGRALPEKFVIATKVGDNWYGMPNNISTASFGTRVLIPITVNNSTSPTTATVYTSTTDYLAWNLDVAGTGTNRYTNKGDHLFFSSPININRDLSGDATGLRNSAVASTSSGYEAFAWSPVTMDLANYTLKNGNATTYYIATDGSANWTTSTTGATVRFLRIDEQPAPDITWRNNTTEEDFYSNKAENGIVTLPATDPESCNTTLYPTFCGWSDTEPDGSYWTSAPSYIEAGTVATSDQTYYAVFKDATRNRWYTQCPTFYTLTFNRGTGTGDDYVVYTENTTYTLPDAATTGLSKDGYTLSGWTTTVAVTVGGSPVAAGDIISVGATVSGISSDLTFTAVWAGNISITAPNGVWLTSYNGVGVYTTSATSNNITISTASKDGATGVKVTYLDGNGDEVTPWSSSLFRLCNDGSVDYNIADNGGTSKTDAKRLTELTLSDGEYKNSYSIKYTPNAHNTTNTYTLKVQLMRNTTSLSEATLTLHGRALPEEFVVASKFSGEWYALPNTLAATEDAARAVAGIKITVDNTGTPTKATYAPNTVVYRATGRYASANAYGIRLTDGSSNYLQVSTTGGKNVMWLSSSGSTACQDWWMNSSDFGAYSVTLPSNTGNESKKIGMVGGNIGYYASPTSPSGQIYFLPIEHKMVDKPASVTEWGKKSVILEVDAQGVAGAQARIGNGDAEVATSFGQTRTSVKNGTTKYNYTVSFSTTDFSAHKGELLYIDWLDGGSNVVSTSTVEIPWIIAEDRDMYKVGETTKGPWNTEVHVLPGVTLTANTASYSPSGATINELNIYPGATVKVTTGTLDVTNLVMRNGWTRAGEKAYDVARLYVQAPVPAEEIAGANLTHTNAYSDWYIDYDQYYPVAVPFPVDTTGICYKNSNSKARAGVKLRYYSGELRAAHIQENQADNWVEYTWKVGDVEGTMPANLEPSKGYIMTAKRPTGKAFSIIRMPMTFTNDWTTDGEQGSIEVDEVTTHKDQVEVTAWGDANTPSYAKGWNIIANPYMSLHQGKLSYNDASGDEIQYANIPDISFKEYDQLPIETTKLKPASAFLVQAPKTGTVTFGATARVVSAPSYKTESTPVSSKQKAYIELSNEEANDMMGLIISDQYTAEYEINADLEKLLGDGTSLKTYMHYSDRDMAYLAINKVLAQEWIPVSVRLPQTGEYTFSLHEASIAGELEGVYLIDYTSNEVTNLIENSYTFVAESGTISNRFAINATVGERQTPTDIDVVNGGGDLNSDRPIKFLYRDKVYIWHRGVIYDATGKKVREINK